MHTIRDIARLATMLAGVIAPRIRLGFASATSRLCLSYVSALPQLRLGFASATSRLRLDYALVSRSPANIVARHAITLIVCLGT